MVTSSEPLRALKELSQNFPYHAVNLARYSKKASKPIVDETDENHNSRVKGGSSDIWLNGKAFQKDSITPLGLLKTLKAEKPLVSSLLSPYMGFSNEQAIKILTTTSIGQAQSEETGGAAPIFDASDRIEKSVRSTYHDTEGVGAITWWNDLEKDSYSKENFAKDLNSLLQPVWPGAFPVIARNLFQVIAVLDLSKKESCRFFAESVSAAVTRIGIRWGVIPGGLEEGGDELCESL